MDADYSDEYIQRLLADLRTKDDAIRKFAMRTLAEPACHARAIPVLIGLLDDNTVIYENTYDAWEDESLWVGHVASDTLKMIGEPALPAIMAALPPHVPPVRKQGLLRLLVNLKAHTALAPMLELYHADQQNRDTLIDAIESLVVPSQDAALVVPYLLQFHREANERSNPRQYKKYYAEQRARLAKLLRPYAVPAAQFIYWRWRIQHTLVMSFALIFAMLFLAVLILLGILSVPVMFIVSGIQKIRQRFFPPPPKVINIGQSPQQRKSTFDSAAASNPASKRFLEHARRFPIGGEKLTDNKLPDETPSSTTEEPDLDTDVTEDSSKE